MSMLIDDVSYTDYVLLLAIILASSYIYNKGSLLPETDPYRHVFFEKPQNRDGAIRSLPISRDIGEKARDAGARFVILWGSQSGTAEALANRLGRDIQQRLESTAIVGDLSDYDPATLANVSGSVVVVLVMSTYGEGEPSDNAQEFMTYMTATTSAVDLSHVELAAFGCGNSSYRYFNKVIHDAVSGMERHGAKPLLPVGAGDEATRSTQEDFLGWKEAFYSLMVSQHGLSDHKAVYRPTVDITVEKSTSDVAQDGEGDDAPFPSKAILLPVISRQTVAYYDDPARSCIDVKLDLARHAQIKYKTGDHIAIWPRNPIDEVDRLLRILGRESERSVRLRITPVDELTELKVPSSTTLLALVSRHLDICAPVPRETILALAQLSCSPTVKSELEKIGSSRETYTEFLECNHLTLARLMELMEAVDPHVSWDSLPLSVLVDFVPAMQPRLYSISSSSIVEPRHVSVAVSVKPGVVPKCPDAAIHGVASTYLSTAQITEPEGNLICAEIRRSTLKLPTNPVAPVIMVAAGTGIAPFRAFVQERARLASIGRSVGHMMLFVGSQNKDDSLFLDEFAEIASKNASSLDLQVVTAFSRPRDADNNAPRRKMYVQDQVFQHRQEVMHCMLEEDAALYICGSTTMAKAVGDVVVEAVMQKKQMSFEEANQWRLGRRKAARWSEDVWG